MITLGIMIATFGETAILYNISRVVDDDIYISVVFFSVVMLFFWFIVFSYWKEFRNEQVNVSPGSSGANKMMEAGYK